MTSPVLLVAGYDRERADFYPPFDEVDLAQFAMFGRELDLLLAMISRTSNGSPTPVDAGSPVAAQVLTGRELQVSRLLARGKTNKEIAAQLGISARTVQTHVANIFDKLGVHNRAGAASWLVEHRVAV